MAVKEASDNIDLPYIISCILPIVFFVLRSNGQYLT